MVSGSVWREDFVGWQAGRRKRRAELLGPDSAVQRFDKSWMVSGAKDRLVGESKTRRRPA